jgi:small subunit ribosomal protein S9
VSDVEQPEDEQRTPESGETPAEEPAVEAAGAPQEPAAEAPEQPAAEAAEPSDAPEQPAEAAQPVAEQPAEAAEQAPAEPVAEQPAPAEAAAGDAEEVEEVEETPRVKPEIPGADLVPDIVPEGADALSEGDDEDGDGSASGEDSDEEHAAQPIADAAISLATGARYRATGKRKTAVARVILKPGNGEYTINGKALDVFFPRSTLQRNIRQPLEAVGYEERMDVIATMHGGGVSSQAGALRHGISRALLEADPNLRGELKKRGFLTRDPRVKERKKAGLKKARKRPQFSKR